MSFVCRFMTTIALDDGNLTVVLLLSDDKIFSGVAPISGLLERAADGREKNAGRLSTAGGKASDGVQLRTLGD